jgi:CubicO group peptidase (beta-lactamase class C family)
VHVQAVELLWTTKLRYPEYGYGFQIRDNRVGHTGGFEGFETFVWYFPESGHAFIIFSNYWDSTLPLIDRMDSRLQGLGQE